MELNLSTVNNWVPYKLIDSNGELFCEWLYTGSEQFKEVFFERAIAKCRHLPQNSGFYKNITSINQLLELAAHLTVEEPAAIVFHTSRCGSTLVLQAFASNSDSMILSEVPFFDDVLKTYLKYPQLPVSLLQAAIKFYSQPKNGITKVFIKTDSWHIMQYSLLRQMFPQVLFILLYRNPAEVITSLNKSPGWHCIPQFISPSFFGITEEVITADDFYNYPVKVIEKYLEAFIDAIENDSNAFLFNYNDGMVQVVAGIYKLLGLPFTDADSTQMSERMEYHSKSGIQFSPGPQVENNDGRFSRLFKLYNQLEGIRLGVKQ